MGASRHRYSICGYAISLLLIACMTFAPGCSLILYQAGARFDAQTPEYEDVQGEDIRKIPRNAEISVIMKKGPFPEGKYKGLAGKKNAEGNKDAASPTYLRLNTTDGLISIDLDNIIFVRKKNELDKKWKYLTGGILLDVLAVVAGYTILSSISPRL